MSDNSVWVVYGTLLGDPIIMFFATSGDANSFMAESLDFADGMASFRLARVDNVDFDKVKVYPLGRA